MKRVLGVGFFFQAEDGIRDGRVTGVQTCALPIWDAAECRGGSQLVTTTDAITELQRRLADGLAKIDPHHRLLGRPVSYRVIDGQMLEITYRDVAGIADAEVNGVKRIIGRDCSCSVSPQTAEQISVRFVVSLK